MGIGNCNYQSYGDYCDPQHCNCAKGQWSINNQNTQTVNATTLLSPEDQKRHQDFVYQCVLGNIVLKSSAKFGRDISMTVQEIVHSSVHTLRQIGTQIEIAARSAGSSSFSPDGPFKIAGIEAPSWIDFLMLQIKLTQAIEDAQDKKEKLKKLKAQLEEFKTPGEKRSEIEAAILALENPTIGAAAIPVI